MIEPATVAEVVERVALSTGHPLVQARAVYCAESRAIGVSLTEWSLLFSTVCAQLDFLMFDEDLAHDGRSFALRVVRELEVLDAARVEAAHRHRCDSDARRRHEVWSP